MGYSRMSTEHQNALCVRALLAALLLLPAACADYRFAVNDRVVYNPDELYSGYQIPDPQLRSCVEHHIKAESITSASQLTELDCRDMNIIGLQGLTVFDNLHYLNLYGSENLPCSELTPWYDSTEVSLTPPGHCPG